MSYKSNEELDFIVSFQRYEYQAGAYKEAEEEFKLREINGNNLRCITFR